MGFGGGSDIVKAPATAPMVTSEDPNVKNASDNQKRRIRDLNGRNKTTLGSGLLVPKQLGSDKL